MSERYPYEVRFRAQIEPESAHLSRLEYCISRRIEYEIDRGVWRFSNETDADGFARAFGGIMSRSPDR